MSEPATAPTETQPLEPDRGTTQGVFTPHAGRGCQGQVVYGELQREDDSATLACQLAEGAAWGGLPVDRAFWTERLLELLEGAEHLIGAVRHFLVRLSETLVKRRLSLLDRIAALQRGIQ